MGLDITATYNRASELCLTTRLTAAGNIKATAGKLFWLVITNSNTSKRYCILHDDNDGTADEIIRFIIPAQTTLPFNFDPPIPCDTGIRIGTIEHSEVIVTGGYV